MNKLLKLVVVFTVVIGFTSCTDLNETEEQAIELQEIQLIDPEEVEDPDDRGGY